MIPPGRDDTPSHDWIDGTERAPAPLGPVLGAATLSAVGLLVVALAYAGARAEAPWAGALYWLGMAAVVVPVLAAAVSAAPSRGQRLALTLGLALALFGVKVLYGPLQFEFHDELQHWRTAVDIARTGDLFTPNALLPISPHFPGLEVATHALTSVTGLSLAAAGTLLVGLAKLVLTGALFRLFEDLTGSDRLAMLATLVYAANPHFTFFGSMYAYGSLALPLMIVALVMLLRWTAWAGTPRADGYGLLTLAALAALVVTHHLTSFAALALLAAWNLLGLVRDVPPDARRPPLLALDFLLLAILGWHLVTGADTVSYLGTTLADVAAALTGTGTASAPPLDRPTWEWIVAAATILVVCLAIPLGTWRLWRRTDPDPLAVTLIAVAATYYLAIGARFLPGGAELAGRTWAFSYLGVALTVAAAALPALADRLPARRHTVLPLMALLFLGGIVLGYPSSWARLPGPYLVSAFERSIEPQGVAAARWQQAHLPPQGRIATDFTNATLAGSYGHQEPVRGVHPVYFAPSLGAEERELLAAFEIDALLVDLRLCEGLPQTGYYVVADEANAYRYDEPLPCEALTKFDGTDGFRRTFDDGAIRIYDLDGGADD